MNAQPIINDKIPKDAVLKIQVPQSNGLEQMNIRIFIILLLIYIYFLYVSYYRDMETVIHLNNELHDIDGGSNLKPFNVSDKKRIEDVVSKYIKNNDKNKSALVEILTETRNGIMRGFIGGSLMGGGFSNIISGAILFGSLGGITKGYNLHFSGGSRLI
jgi:hypothetical protein